jgi:hypothetical protein
VGHLDNTDEALVARVAKAILVELGHVAPPKPCDALDPEARITDPEARRKLYGNCSRSKFWALMKAPDAPPAHLIGRTKIRRVRDHLAFIARNPAV